jgi:hypothetical protein
VISHGLKSKEPMGDSDVSDAQRGLSFFKEEPARLIVNRRTIAAGLAALVSAPAAAAAGKLAQLTNVPLTFDPGDFTGLMSDGIFLPDYRNPRARILFDDGGTTRWMRWDCRPRKTGVSYSSGLHVPARDTVPVAIETCAPDKNGNPRYAQLAIG